MAFSGGSVPFELQNCPQDVLERYVRARLLALAGSASVSKRLNISAEALRQAFAESLAEATALQGQGPDTDASGPPFQLTFGHDCQHLGCLESGCPLCAQNPNRRCGGSFSTKYLSGDVLKANCGASIRVQVLDRSTLEPVRGPEIEGIQLEMCIVDGKAYAALQDAGRETYAEDVEACILPINNQGRELLVPGRGASHNSAKWVVVPLVRGVAHLPDLSVTGSSEALLSGQKPPFRLLVRAVGRDGARSEHIRFIVSDAFVVATPRVRTAAKAEIPHLDDHVSKLHAVGNMTQSKLLDISGAAAAVGVYNLHVPHNTVTKVGQFRELVEVAERDAQLCETLKKVLKLTRGWEVARDHARTAVATDNRMRVWCADRRGMSGGLLYKCHLGSVELDSPIGLLKSKQGSGGQQTTLEAVLVTRLPPGEKEKLKRLQRQAASCWWQPGHPGWAVWPVDTQAFLQEVAAPGNQPSMDQLLGGSMAEGVGQGLFSERPLTRAAAQATAQPGHASEATSSHSDGAAQAGVQPARSSTPSEGGASLDGWVSNSLPAAPAPTLSGSTGDLQFPAIPQAQPQLWDSHPRFQQPAATGSGRHHPNASMAWESGTTSRPHQGGNSLPSSSAGLYAAWRQEGDSLADTPAWEVPQLQPGFAGLPGMPAASSSLNRGAYQPPQQYGLGISPPRAMPSSGNVRKRESQPPAGVTNIGSGESDPLPSPFGLPELQNMDLPALGTAVPASRAMQMQQRISSGIEPSSAKRRHLSPAELQQRLSHLVGRPLGAQEMSLIIPNFPDLLDDPSISPDLPSMTLTTSDLAGLMDSMLEPRPPIGQLLGAMKPAPGTPRDPAGAGEKEKRSNNLPVDSYTYADLSQAVDAMHEQRTQGHASTNATLDKPRTSSMLMDYLASRLAAPEAGAKPEEITERKSGLDTMPLMVGALPTK